MNEQLPYSVYADKDELPWSLLLSEGQAWWVGFIRSRRTSGWELKL